MSVGDVLENCGMGTAAGYRVGAITGAAGGGTVGLMISIRTCIDYIQPALAAVDGISPTGATAITIGIAFCGYAEICIGLCAGAGALSMAILGAAIGGCCGCCINDKNDEEAQVKPLEVEQKSSWFGSFWSNKQPATQMTQNTYEDERVATV